MHGTSGVIGSRWLRGIVAIGLAGLGACAVAPEGGGANVPRASLTDTYWKLVALGGQPAQVADGQREPHLVLHREAERLAGSGGCNRLMGRWRVDGEGLAFSQIATTRMACPAGMEQENRFLAALGTVARHRIEGEQLTLIDASGAVVARLQAVALR
ncbi:MAG: META domain-containing protein [Ideonella sp.]|jgi:heat shock protein HslJ|nr:META domain-containing protein [Ideonella sp.]